jgi:hypothetical protein
MGPYAGLGDNAATYRRLKKKRLSMPVLTTKCETSDAVPVPQGYQLPGAQQSAGGGLETCC